MERDEINGIVREIVGAAYEVANTLGPGFLEKVYERALCIELKERGVEADNQVSIPVRYRSQIVGSYTADLLVADRVLVELKCVDSFSDEHIAQCINYLSATGLKMCLLINFRHQRVRWRRVVHNL